MPTVFDGASYFTRRQSDFRYVRRSELDGSAGVSGFIDGLSIVPGTLPASAIVPLTIGAGEIADGALNARRLFEGSMTYIEVVDSLPVLPDSEYPLGTTVFLSGTGTFQYSGDTEIYQRGKNYTNKLVNSVQKWVTALENVPESITLANFARTVRPPELVDALPDLTNPSVRDLYPFGAQVFLKPESRLYKSYGNAPTARWAELPSGPLKNAAALGWDPVVDSSALTGLINGSQIAQNALDMTHFASSIRPVVLWDNTPLPVLPDPLYPVGSTLFLKASSDPSYPALALYRNVNGSWRRTGAQDLEADSVVAGTVAAGAIGTRELVAGAVRAEKLAVGNWNNLCGDPGFEYYDFYGGHPNPNEQYESNSWLLRPDGVDKGFSVESVGSRTGNRVLRRSNLGNNVDPIRVKDRRSISVSPGDSFYLEAYVRFSGPLGSMGRAGLRLRFYTTTDVLAGNEFLVLDGSNETDTSVYIPEGSTSPRPASDYQSWQKIARTVSVPSSPAVVAASIELFVDSHTSGDWYFDDVNVVRVVDGVYLAEGAVTAKKIAAGAIEAGKLAVGAVLAGNLGVDAVTAGTIAAGAIGARELAARSITADKLLIGNLHNFIDDPGFELYDTTIPASVNPSPWGASSFSANGFSIVNRASVPSPGARSGTQYALREGGATSYGYLRHGAKVQVAGGEKFYLKMFARASLDCTPTSVVRLQLDAFDRNGNFLRSYDSGSGGLILTPSTITYNGQSSPSGVTVGWGEFTNTITIPQSDVSTSDTPVSYVQFAIRVSGHTVGWWAFDDVYFTRLTDGVFIADGSITANKLEAGSITAAVLSAGSISTNYLISGNFDNLCECPGFEPRVGSTTPVLGAGRAWRADGDAPNFTVSNRPGWARSGNYCLTKEGGGTLIIRNNQKVEVRYDSNTALNDKFFVECYIRPEADTGGAMPAGSQGAGIFVQFQDKNLNVISSSIYGYMSKTQYDANVAGGGSEWQRIQASGQAPSGAVLAHVCLYADNTQGRWHFDDVYFKKQVISAYISDAAIQNVHIADATITAAKVASLNADIITAGTLEVERLLVNNLMNLCADPGFERTTSNTNLTEKTRYWWADNNSNWNLVTNASLARRGNKYAHILSSNRLWNRYIFDVNTDIKVYAEAWLSPQTGSAYVEIVWHMKDGSVTTTIGNIVSGSGYKLSSVFATPPTSAVKAQFTVYATGSCYVDDTFCSLGIRGVHIDNIDASKITTGTLDASKVQVTKLDASSIESGIISAERIDAEHLVVARAESADTITANLSADKISGGTLILGGSTNGSFKLRNAANNDIVTMSSNGLELGLSTSKVMTLDSNGNLWAKTISIGGADYNSGKIKTDTSGNMFLRDANFKLTNSGGIVRISNIAGVNQSGVYVSGQTGGSTLTGLSHKEFAVAIMSPTCTPTNDPVTGYEKILTPNYLLASVNGYNVVAGYLINQVYPPDYTVFNMTYGQVKGTAVAFPKIYNGDIIQQPGYSFSLDANPNGPSLRINGKPPTSAGTALADGEPAIYINGNVVLRSRYPLSVPLTVDGIIAVLRYHGLIQ